MSEKKFSDEFLNSFIDDQLTAEEKSRAFVEMQQDESISREVCELRKLSDLVRLAYRDVPPPPTVRPRANLRLSGLAAGIALVFGVALGWLLHTPRPAAGPGEAGPLASLAPLAPGSNVVGRAASGGQMKVLMHISDGTTAHLRQALNEIETLARHYRESGQNARIEVVMNGDGLNLVRADVSPFRARVAQLQKDYDSVVFEACQNTLDRLRLDQGLAAQLLPGVTVIDSGVAQIMRRQYQGWAYIQV